MNRLVVDKNSIENKDTVLITQIMAAVRGIKYGCVQITVNNSEVVQIDKIEKIRIRKPRDCIC